MISVVRDENKIRPTGAVSGSAISILATIIILVFNSILNIGLGWLLSPADYGTYGTSVAILTILIFLATAGLAPSTTKFLAEENLTEARKRLIYRSSLFGNLAVVLVISVIYYIISSLFAPMGMSYTSFVVIILVTTLIFSIKAINNSALIGFFRFKEWRVVDVLEAVLRLAVCLLLVYVGYGVLGALIGYLVGTIIAMLLSVYYLRHFKAWGGKGWIDTKVFSFALPVFIAMMAINLVSNVDIVVVKFLTSTSVSSELVGYYQAALFLARLPLYIAGALAMATLPFISKSGENSIDTYAWKSIKYTLLFILPLSLAMIVMPDGLLKLFFAAPYIQGATVLAILAIGMGLLSISITIARVFQGLGKPKIPAIVLAPSMVLQFICLLVLIPRYGIVGAALATTTACLVGMVSLAVVYFRMYKPKIKWDAIGLFIISSGLFAVIIHFMPISNRLLIVLGLVIAVFIYVLLLLTLGLLAKNDLDILFQALPVNKFTKRLLSISQKLILRTQ